MILDEIRRTLKALKDANVRFLIAGGFAVVAHGHSRVTHDLDLVLALDPDNTRNAIETLLGLGFRTRLPVDPYDFCDPELRAEWIRTKNLQVFSMVNEAAASLVIDLFAELPFEFEAELQQAYLGDLDGFPDNLPFVSKSTLIDMKRKAGRPIDLDDIMHLELSI